MNINDYSTTLKKGAVLGWCSPVSAIVHRVEATSDASTKIPSKLNDVIVAACKGLNPKERREIKDLVCRYQDVFDTDNGNKGRTSIVSHRINTGNASPIRQAPRRLPLAKREEAEHIVRDMENEGIIEPSSSPWASPVVLVRKKDGSTRFCVDYRRLNSITKKDSYPLPRIDDTLDTLAGAKWFSTLDLKSGYWQVGMEPNDREKTAFTMGSGLWQFTVMPFGLCNAPATFERLMDTVLKGLSWDTCLVYLDDVIVVGKTFQDHLKNLEQVFRRLRDANLKLSPKKCHLFRNKVNYLGHVVSEKGIAVDSEKVDAVEKWPIPKDKHELRSFLGLCTYYRRYVPGFANIAKPLTRLTENRPFSWNPECQSSFDLMKATLVNAPILSYPLPNGKFILDTDASNVGIGGVLSQTQEGQEKVIGYFSKTLSKPERNYCVTRRELLAVVKSVEHFYKYLYGRKFAIRTDHAALKWLLNFKNPEGQIARWIERLQEYDFDIEHRAGLKHCNADALSRRPCSENCKHCDKVEDKTAKTLRTTVVDDHWQPDNLRAAQKADQSLGTLWEWKQTGQRPSWQEVALRSPELKSYWAQWDSLIVEDGFLKRIWENADGTQRKAQMVIPREKVPGVLRELHDGSSGGHFGVHKTLEKVRQRFYWVNYARDVKEWCRKCITCSASNGPQKRRRAPMRQYNVGSPFERIAIDVAGPFPETGHGNKYIVVVMDYFTKWVEAYALPNQEAATIADVMVKEFVSRFGVPLELHSDQGRNFESELFQNLCELLGIRKTRTTPLHPQSDGMVERMNKTMIKHLSKVVSGHQRDWDEHLPLFLMAYRASVNGSTSQSPANVLFGRELRLPCDLKFGCKPGEDLAGEDYVSRLRRRLDDIHEQVRRNIQDASDRMKESYDINTERSGYQIGDLVWLYNPQRRRGLSPKLQKDWEGPYQIIKRINDVIYRIRRTAQSKPKVVHSNRLARYSGANNEEEVCQMFPQLSEPTYEDFMEEYSGSRKARFGVTTEKQQDLFTVPADYALAHSVAQDLRMTRGIAEEFKRRYGKVRELRQQKPIIGKALHCKNHDQSIFYLVTKELSSQKSTYKALWESLIDLRAQILGQDISKLAIPKLGCGLDRLSWRIVKSMVEVLFQHTGVEIMVCSYQSEPRKQSKTVDCFFYSTSGCDRGSSCRFRHRLLETENECFGTKPVLRRGQCDESVTRDID